MYEMQRETEAEKLFHGHMFRLARTEEDTQTQASQIIELRQQLNALQQQLKARDMDERLATSKVRMDALQSRVNLIVTTMEGQQNRLDSFAKEVANSVMPQSVLAVQHPTPAQEWTDGLRTSSVLSQLNELLEDRNAVLDVLATLDERIKRIEERADVQQLASHHEILSGEANHEQTESRLQRLEEAVGAVDLHESVDFEAFQRLEETAEKWEAQHGVHEMLVGDLTDAIATAESQIQHLNVEVEKLHSEKRTDATKIAAMEVHITELEARLEGHTAEHVSLNARIDGGHAELVKSNSHIQDVEGKVGLLASANVTRDANINTKASSTDLVKAGSRVQDLEQRLASATSYNAMRDSRIQVLSDELKKSMSHAREL